MVFRCGEGYVLEACSSSCFVFNKIQKGRQAPGQRVFGSRSVLQWHGVLVWRGYVLEACSSSCFVFNKIHKGRQAPGQRVFESRSVLQWHGVLVWRGYVLEACSSSCFVFNKIHKGRQAPGQRFFWKSFRPSVAWCFGVARGTFWRPAAAVVLLLTRSRRDVNIG